MILNVRAKDGLGLIFGINRCQQPDVVVEAPFSIPKIVFSASLTRPGDIEAPRFGYRSEFIVAWRLPRYQGTH